MIKSQQNFKEIKNDIKIIILMLMLKLQFLIFGQFQSIYYHQLMELEQKQPQRILILGGTNFMGKSLLDTLSERKPQAQVYCINRGKIYWNNEVRKQHNYEHFSADRKQHRDSNLMVKYLNEKLKISQSNKWKAVIDFSAFKWRDVQSVLKAINNLAERYIYISTDSIYNNNESQKQRLPVKEENFNIESECSKMKKQENKNDKYGYNKLKCEVYIKRRSKIPSYCLRLPDVIGPFDNTDRFWTTLEWVKRSHQYPIQLSGEDEQRQLSFVYSLDVCRFILQLTDQKHPKSDSINVAFKENPSLEELIRLIAKHAGVEPTFKAVKIQSNNCYPSTEFGYISVQKLTKQYGFQPSTLSQAIFQTVKFFNEKGSKYETQKKQMERMLHKKIKNRAE